MSGDFGPLEQTPLCRMRRPALQQAASFALARRGGGSSRCCCRRGFSREPPESRCTKTSSREEVDFRQSTQGPWHMCPGQTGTLLARAQLTTIFLCMLPNIILKYLYTYRSIIGVMVSLRSEHKFCFHFLVSTFSRVVVKNLINCNGSKYPYLTES